MAGQVLGAVEAFYDCMGETYDYARALKFYSAAAENTAVAYTSFHPLTRKVTVYGAHNFDPEALQGWRPSKVKCDAMERMVKAATTIPVCVPIMRRTLVPDSMWECSKTYERVSKPWGYHDDGSSILAKNMLKISTCGFARLPGQSALSTNALASMAYMNKHLVRATSLHQRISKTEEMLLQSNTILDLVEFGIVMFGADRRVKYSNAAAKRIFEESDGISYDADGLKIEASKTDEQFCALLSAICDTDVPHSDRLGGMLSIPRRSPLNSYVISLVPVFETSQSEEGIAAVAFISDPRKRQTTAISLLSKTYGFTATESELAISLISGQSLHTIADNRGVSYNTVKTHLHSVFSKTHTKRQAELTSLLLTSMAGVSIRPTA
ncbi:MAG: LuxR C-terminal-related transcriptional regulator [Hyphomicrobiales bacterium]